MEIKEYEEKETHLKREIRYLQSLAEREPLGSPKERELQQLLDDEWKNLKALEKLKL